ncbi:MAG: rhomboid family intramembrane serine protease [Dehalococcoidales bacterium]|nr:rhomboid family intramembrane serine protease [Dehalococcoidales bacterium]
MLNPIFIIIGINAAIFLAVNISNDLVYDIALWAPLEYMLAYPWGIITSMFTHYDFTHILFNMITFYFFGSYLLKLIGIKKFLIIYFAGGLLGGVFFVLLQTLMDPGGFALAIGASGAVFALGGTLAVLMPNLKVFILFIPIPVPLWIAVIGGGIIMSLFANVAWEAHLGGLLLGLAAGYIIKNQKKPTYYF